LSIRFSKIKYSFSEFPNRITAAEKKKTKMADPSPRKISSKIKASNTIFATSFEYAENKEKPPPGGGGNNVVY